MDPLDRIRNGFANGGRPHSHSQWILSAVESCEQKCKILHCSHPDLKSTYCFYAHMHEIMKLNRSKSACRIHWAMSHAALGMSLQ